MTDKTWPDDAREKWRAKVGVNEYGHGRALYVSAQRPDGVRLAVTGLVWTPVERFSVYPPTLQETYEEERDRVGDVTNFLQAVVDAAWEAGIKPVQAKAGDGEIGAVRAHLEDMRTLVFDGPEGKKP